MRRLWFRVQCVLMFCIGIVSAYFASGFLVDYLSSGHSPDDKLVWGTVIKRSFAPQRFRPTGPRLTIRVDHSEDVAHADLANDRIDEFPDRVSFYYSGDPRKEVHLVLEENLIGAIATLYFAAGVFMALPVFAWQVVGAEIERGEKKAVGELQELRGVGC